MVAPDKRLYRSRDALIGGVCSGMAEYFDIDPIIMRILAVVLTLATAGTFAVAYVALWIILPLAPDPTAPVDVKPESVHSETYGHVHYETPPATPDSASPAASGYDAYGTAAAHSYTPAGHVPPEPPTSYAEAQQNHDADGGPYGAPVAQSAPPAPTGAPVDVAGQVEPASKRSVRVALWIGFICLFIGFSALLGHVIGDVSWWQFWPLLFVIAGIVNVVVPAQRGKRMSQFVGGLMEIAIGAVLLAMSLDLISYASFYPMIESLWPLLIMMVGFFILAGALKNSLFELLAGVCFIAFCVIGLLWFTIPGTTEYLVIELPFKEAVTIDINPWDGSLS